MELSPIIDQYLPALKDKYAVRLLPGHLSAIHAMLRCRTPNASQIILPCNHCTTTVMGEHTNPAPVDTAVARNVRTMKQAFGLTGNRPSYCRSSISW